MAKTGFFQENTVVEETGTSLSATTSSSASNDDKPKSSFYARNQEYEEVENGAGFLADAEAAETAAAASATAAAASATAAAASAASAAAVVSDEAVQDIVGAMVSGNTETLITVTYQDSDGTIDFVVDNDLANYSNATSAFLTAATADALFLTPAEGNAAYQPLDADLTAIAAVATAAYGRSLLTLANATALYNEVDSVDAWLKNVVEDTTPQLGGDLDLNNFLIKDSSLATPITLSFDDGTAFFSTTNNTSYLYLHRDDATPANGDYTGIIRFSGQNSTPAFVDGYASIYGKIVDKTAASEDGMFQFTVLSAGAELTALTLDGSAPDDGSGNAVFATLDGGSVDFPTLYIQGTSAAGGGPGIIFYSNSASPAASDNVWSLAGLGKDSGGNQNFYSNMYVAITDATNGSEDAQHVFQVGSGGALVNGLILDGSTSRATIFGIELNLADAGADRLFGWDDSANQYANLSAADAFTVIKAQADAVYQPLDADLTTIAGLTATTDNFIQSKSSAWASRTPTQVTADLINFVGDAGAGGTKGLVPAPAIGDATKFLKGDGTWTSIPGGGDALTANPLSQFAATTSAQLAGVISDETGSGVLVFGTSPSFTTSILPSANDAAAIGTGALSFSDLFLASGGVINWANGNVTITHSSGTLDIAADVLSISTSASGSTGAGFATYHDSASPAADDDIAYWTMYAKTSTNVMQPYAEINGYIADATNADFSGKLSFDVWSNTARLSALQFTGALGLTTPTADGGGIGGWNDVMKIDLGSYTNYPSIEFHNNDPGALYGTAFTFVANHAAANGTEIHTEVFYAKNSTPALFQYARWSAGVVDKTAASEDGGFYWNVAVAGDGDASRMYLQNGLSVTNNAAGTFKGSGTINASDGLYDKGYRVGGVIVSSGTITGSPTTVSFALPGGFKHYRLLLSGMLSAATATDCLDLLCGTGGGPTYYSGASDYAYSWDYVNLSTENAATNALDGQRNYSSIYMFPTLAGTNGYPASTSYGSNYDLFIWDAHDTVVNKVIEGTHTQYWNYEKGNIYGVFKGSVASLTSLRIQTHQSAGIRRGRYELIGYN